MATETDISNLALSHFGQDASIDSIDPPDGSVDGLTFSASLYGPRGLLTRHLNLSAEEVDALIGEAP